MQYMSPERLNGNGTGYSWPADVWSAGLIMLECAMGQHPYAAIGETVSLPPTPPRDLAVLPARLTVLGEIGQVRVPTTRACCACL